MQCEGDVVDNHLRLALPIMIFMYLFLLCYLVGSSTKGHHAIIYLCRLLCCCSNERYETVLRQDMQERARESQRLRRLDLVLAAARGNTQKVAARLKTKLYNKTTMHMHPDCMICLADFVAGDIRWET